MPRFIQRLYPERLWAFSRNSSAVYLTFDDGPIPEVTPWVLDELKKHNAKATFFCIGANVKKYPEIFNRIISEGHSVGNHTFNHLNGWETDNAEYVDNVEMARETMLNAQNLMRNVGCEVNDERPPQSSSTKSNSSFVNCESLFRPPYGRIKSSQAKILHDKGYQIVMWDIISYDFDASVSPEECLQNVLKNIQTGSIIVFHDSLKVEKNLRYVLPKVLEFISNKGWNCLAVPNT